MVMGAYKVLYSSLAVVSSTQHRPQSWVIGGEPVQTELSHDSLLCFIPVTAQTGRTKVCVSVERHTTVKNADWYKRYRLYSLFSVVSYGVKTNPLYPITTCALLTPWTSATRVHNPLYPITMCALLTPFTRATRVLNPLSPITTCALLTS